MSGFKTSIARNVQYSRDGVVNEAAIVTGINPDGTANLFVIGEQSMYRVTDAVEYVYTFDARKLHQPNTYRLNWQGR
jgi:hypothetical protein